MSMLYFFLGIPVGLGLAAAALAAFYVRGKRRSDSAPKIQGYLDLIPGLTDDQKDKVQEIRRTFLPKVEGIRREMRLNRAKLADLLFAEPADREAIYQVAGMIAGSQSELEREVIEHILEEKELLTLEQKQRFFEIIVAQFSSGGLGVHDVKSR